MSSDGELLARLRRASIRSLVGQLEMIHELGQGLDGGGAEQTDGEPASGDFLFDAARRILEQQAKVIETGVADFDEFLRTMRQVGALHARPYPRRTVHLRFDARGGFSGAVAIENTFARTLARTMSLSFHGGEFIAEPDPAALPRFTPRLEIAGDRILGPGEARTFTVRVTDLPPGSQPGRYGSDTYVSDAGAIAGLLHLVMDVPGSR